MALRLLMTLTLFFLVSCAEDPSDGIVPTVYYKPTFSTSSKGCVRSKSKELLSTKGKVLESLCAKDYDECVLQGSCYIEAADGKTVSFNVHSRINGSIRFGQTDTERCPLGMGTANTCLDPYFSVAADLSFYKLGDVIFVPRLAGVKLPTGETHDGYLVVRDTGGAIIGPDRFDFYTGTDGPKAEENIFVRLGFGDKNNRFDYRRANQTETLRVQTARKYPNNPY